jgi:hypothetical protein
MKLNVPFTLAIRAFCRRVLRECRTRRNAAFVARKFWMAARQCTAASRARGRAGTHFNTDPVSRSTLLGGSGRWRSLEVIC